MELLLSYISNALYLFFAFVFVISLFKLNTFLKMYGVPQFAVDNWHQQFEDLQMSSDEFYSKITDILKEKQFPDTRISRAILSQRGFFYSERQYLRISREGYIFDICAAPFGKNFFISWWLGMDISVGQLILLHTPFISKAYTKSLLTKTYYQKDTEVMFREAIQDVVAKVVHDISKDHENTKLSRISFGANELVK